MINIKNDQPKKRLNFKQAQISDIGSGTRKTPWLQPYGHPANVRFSANYTYLEKQSLGNHVCTHMWCERKQLSLGHHGCKHKYGMCCRPMAANMSTINNQLHIKFHAYSHRHTHTLRPIFYISLSEQILYIQIYLFFNQDPNILSFFIHPCHSKSQLLIL